MPASLPSEKKFCTLPQTANRYGVRTLWVRRKMESDPTFPRPCYFNGVKKPYFLLTELEAWDRAAIEARPERAA